MKIFDIAFIMLGILAIIMAIVALILSIVLPGPKCKCDWGVDNQNTFWSYVRADLSLVNQVANTDIILNSDAYMTNPPSFEIKNRSIKSLGPNQIFFIEGYLIISGSIKSDSSIQIKVDNVEITSLTSKINKITYVSGYFSVPQNSTVSLYTTSNLTLLSGSHLSLSSTNGIPQFFINPN